MNTPKIDLIVTRHPSLVQYLRELRIVTEDTPVIEHAKADDVRGKHVLGILPHHLSAAAATITEIPMRTTEQDRADMQRGDLSLERVRQIAGEPVTYTVEAGWSPAKLLPVALEPHPNGRDAWLNGGDRTHSGRYYLSPLALRPLIHFDTKNLGYYRDGGSWVVQGVMRLDRALWERGIVKDSHEHTAVEHEQYVQRCTAAGLEPLDWREAIEIMCAVVIAVEWHELTNRFAASSDFGDSRPVAIMQHEPIVLLPNEARARLRHVAINGDVRSWIVEPVQVQVDDDDGLLDFEVERDGVKVQLRGRCRNEAVLIDLAQRRLQRRLAQA